MGAHPERASDSSDKRMTIRYAGTCRICGASLPAKSTAIYERATKTVRCIECRAESEASAGTPEDEEPVSSPEEPGVAGTSARREYQRRKVRDEEQVRKKWGRLGPIAVALSEEKQSTKAWATGAIGEERLGALLDSLVSDSLAVLHDRRVPRSNANIDHIAITRAGIWVIDAKRYHGRPQLKVDGGILRPRVERVLVGRRDCTKLVDGVLKQVAMVREAAGPFPVTGALCFVDADWPLVGGAFTSREVRAVWPKLLAKLLIEAREGVVDVSATCESLASRFRSA
jgi:hypothetical protein